MVVLALDLPELRTHVGQFLDQEDLVSSLCVSRDWHDSFMPLRWRDMRIIGIHSVRADVNLRRHAHLVRSLSFLRIRSLRHFSHVDRYTNLERIHITKTDIEGRKVWEKLSLLVQQNWGTLRSMVLEDMMPLKEFLIALGEQDQHSDDDRKEEKDEEKQMKSNEERGLCLNSLTWKRVTVYVSCHAHFWKACRRATRLVLECLTIKGTGLSGTPASLNEFGSTLFSLGEGESGIVPSSAAGAFALSSNAPLSFLSTRTRFSSAKAPEPTESCRVQHLRVSWTIDLALDLQLLLWIQPCTQLRSLTWEAFSFPDTVMANFAHLLRSHVWRFLTALEITSCMTQYPTDASLSVVLDASRNPLERLCLRNVDFGPLAFKSLRERHFRGLRTLMLVNCGAKVTSRMAREVLESCEKLEIFQWPYLLVEDMRMQHEQETERQQKEAGLLVAEIQGPLTIPFLPLSPQSSPTPPRHWVCLGLHTLYIAATVVSYTSPPLTNEEEAVIWRRLEPLKKLKSFRLGASISSASSVFSM